MKASTLPSVAFLLLLGHGTVTAMYFGVLFHIPLNTLSEILLVLILSLPLVILAKEYKDG